MSRIEIRELSYAYGGQMAIEGVSSTFSEGSVTGLIGPNGSGKTTLLKLAFGELAPLNGTVTLDGKPVRSITARQRARRIAVVPQRAVLEFDFTVLDMVLMGRQPYMGRFAREDQGDIDLAMAAMSKLGIDQLRTRNARTLSGGEWQRVLIARALCQNTRILLMDEPVSSLDIRHQMEVLSTIRALAHDQGVTVAIVLHDLNLAAHYCDRLVLMQHGKLIADGTVAEVMTPERLKQAYDIEAAVETQPDGSAVIVPVYL